VRPGSVVTHILARRRPVNAIVAALSVCIGLISLLFPQGIVYTRLPRFCPVGRRAAAAQGEVGRCHGVVGALQPRRDATVLVAAISSRNLVKDKEK